MQHHLFAGTGVKIRMSCRIQPIASNSHLLVIDSLKTGSGSGPELFPTHERGADLME